MTTNLLRPFAAAALLALAVAGCGGAEPRAGAGTDRPTPTPTLTPASGATSTNTATTPGATGTSRPGSTATPGGTGGTDLPYPTHAVTPTGKAASPTVSLKPMAFSAKLERTCVAVGGSQTVTVDTRPGALVTFDSKYADGSTGNTHGGADPGGKADANGRYTKTWTLAPTAPAGAVQVYVAAHETGYKTQATLLTFELKTACS